MSDDLNEFNFDDDSSKDEKTSLEEQEANLDEKIDSLGGELGGFSSDEEDDFQEDPDMSAKKGSSIVEKLIDLAKENMLYIIVGAVMLVVVLYLIFGVVFSGSSAPVRRREPVRQSMKFNSSTQYKRPVVVKKVEPVKKPVKEKQGGKTTSAFVSPDSVQMSKKDFKALIAGFQAAVSKQVKEETEKNAATFQKELAKLQNKMNQMNVNQQQELKNLVMGMQKFSANIQAQLRQVSTTMSELNNDLAAIPQQLKATKDQLQLLLAQRAQNAENYTLRAVVPGRAWIVDGSGKTITITKGDKIPYYGVVKKVDDKTDKVYMSSGYVFS